MTPTYGTYGSIDSHADRDQNSDMSQEDEENQETCWGSFTSNGWVRCCSVWLYLTFVLLAIAPTSAAPTLPNLPEAGIPCVKGGINVKVDPCTLAWNCRYEIKGDGNCAPAITAYPNVTYESVVNGLSKRRCSSQLVSTVQPGRTYKYYGTYEPAWAAHSLCYERCGQNGCSVNYEKTFSGSVVYLSYLASQTVYGRVTQSFYPPVWDVRNAMCDGLRESNFELQKYEPQWYELDYGNGYKEWKENKEWKGLDWQQITYFTKTSCEDGAVYWNIQGVIVVEYNTFYHGKFEHFLCGQFANLLGAIANRWAPFIGGQIGSLISSAC